MQDSKEQPPPAPPEDIVKMSKHKLSSDANPREIFWAMVEAYRENEGFGEMVEKYAGVREALVNIGCSVLQEHPKAHRMRVPKATLAKCLFSMIVVGKWGDVLERALSNLYERKKGPHLKMMMAFGDAFEKNKELVGGWLKGILSEERPPEAVLAYISEVGDKQLVKYLRGELLNIARTEINEPQVFAMEALAILLPEDADAAKLFVDMMDDWDLETKRVALETLKAHKIEPAAKKAVGLYAYEPDEIFRMSLEHIISNSKEAAGEEFTKMFSRLRGREMEEIGALARKIYGKKRAKGLIPESLPPEVKKQAETAVG
ncbi:hypothetical protein GF412_03430 [Candidatus Micrarchaeota archaeon]|nr:hypothetical protein [Candidatus Micrarchaeota archaeon]MBD3418003.1 hypothetical protein [Candidatus Micrarchaeota archaeon]